MKVEEGFQPIKYPDEHPYFDDAVLPGLLKRLLPDGVRNEVEADLGRLGEDLINKTRPLAPQLHAATLTQYDEWGRRVDLLQTSEGWRKLKETASKEGYIANAYERKYKELSRVYMFAKTMVMTGDYHVIVCPFSMTDGAVRLMELHGTPEMKKQILPRLISRDPEEAYFSGQWMTERIGGSDVSLTETAAKPTKRIASDLGEPYLIDGFKWFSSAAEGNMAFALARTGDASSGSRGLSLFLIPVRFQQYNTPLSNGVRIHRLKEKFGTIAVPTAELSLEGTRGWLVGPENAGVKMISTLLNITRVHSSIHSLGSLQRALSIARSYSTVRTVNRGTTLLQDIPLHVSGLANVTLLYRALTHLAFGVIALLGRSENGVASAEEESRLRLLTPVLKAFAAQKAVGGIEECMAALGGQGYMEETGIGRLIRDAMIEKIWEGTVEVLSIDLNRATASATTVKHYTDWAFRTLSKGPLASLSSAKATLKSALNKFPALFHKNKSNPVMPRIMLNVVGNVTAGVYLYEHAIWAAENGERSKDVDVESCRRWVEEGDLAKCLDDVEAISVNVDKRVELNSAFVYGPRAKTKL